ncbi:MAG: nitroreductase family protein [Syntrophobacterales bacterium]|nr:nitroreductase family protein [Syntrophobacterales bacterium]
MELQKAIMERKSVRKFSEYYVTDEEIKTVLEAARWAPSWANTQPWKFIVVRDRDLIERVTGTYAENNPATKCSLAASALIIGCAKTGVSGYKDKLQTTKFSEWFMFDLGMAVQNLCLKSYELGLGTVVVGLLDHDKCKKILLVPDDYEAVISIPVGRPATVKKDHTPRNELKDFVYENRFGNPFGCV